MTEDSIRFERTIQAPPAEAFYAFSTAQGWRDWLCDSARFRPISGRNYQLSWNDGWFAAGSIEDLQRPQKVVLNWRGKDDPQASTVSIELAEVGGATQVSLTHAGLGEGEAWAGIREEIRKGWEMGLENLESIFSSGEDLRVVRRPMLGIMLNDFDARIAAEIGVPVDQGVRIDQALEGMGAARAGLQHDDVIVEMGGVTVNGGADLTAALAAHRAGDVIPVTVYRGKERKSFEMELSRRPIPEVPLDPKALARAVEGLYQEIDQELADLLEGVSDEQLKFRPGQEAWSALETLAHLVDAEQFNLDTIAQSLSDAEREFVDQGTNSPEFIASLLHILPTVAQLTAELKRRQRQTVYLLAHADKLKQRKTVMWRLGRGWLEIPGAHERQHFEQMRAAIEAARQAGVG